MNIPVPNKSHLISVTWKFRKRCVVHVERRERCWPLLMLQSEGDTFVVHDPIGVKR